MNLRKGGLKRIVSVCRVADRHADLHDRGFAETRSVTVPDGELRDVVAAALAEVGFTEGARFVITVEEPHECLTSPGIRGPLEARA